MNLDPNFTKSIQSWLETPENVRDIRAGAELLLALNRNRALFNSVIRRPEKFGKKVEYELRKFLRMRLDNMSVADVVRMEQKLVPRINEIISASTRSQSAENSGVAPIAHGRRNDHDSLPEEVRELWDSNQDRIRRINILFNELKAMNNAQPCDRYDKLVLLDKLDKQYRRNLAEYDSFVASTQTAEVVSDVSVDNSKVIAAARKTISKYRKLLNELSNDDDRYNTALCKIQDAVYAIVASGAGVARETEDALRPLGIKFD